MPPSPRAPEKRRRLTPRVRQDQIVAAAARLVLEQGHLPLPLEALARAAGVSKALIYAYFRTQPDLFNALLAREFRALAARGLVEAAALADLEAAALASAMIYFEHVAAGGPLIHLILRDPYMTGHVQAGAAAFRDRIILSLARRARAVFRLTSKETIAAIGMTITIPEEAGRMVHAGELSPRRGRALCIQLMQSSLGAFRPLPDEAAPTG